MRIPFSVEEPKNNESYLSRFFSVHHDIPGVVVMNSRGNYVANYLPVSYTHLDVYKRQQYGCCSGKTLIG